MYACTHRERLYGFSLNSLPYRDEEKGLRQKFWYELNFGSHRYIPYIKRKFPLNRPTVPKKGVKIRVKIALETILQAYLQYLCDVMHSQQNTIKILTY